MACFIVSAAEAVVVTAIEKRVEKKEQAAAKADDSSVSAAEPGAVEKAAAIPLSRKLKWLKIMLWGGVVLLLFEHIWHGEVVPWVPFLTAASDPTATGEMLFEIATNGVIMAGLVTGVWAIACRIADAKVRSRVSDSKKAM